jgi:hypothetical protein
MSIRKPSKAETKEWEAKLSEFGLSNKQIARQEVSESSIPQIEGSEFENGIQHSQFDADIDRNTRQRNARFDTKKKIEAHRIVKPKQHTRTVPAWAFDDAKVRELLQDAFPRLKSSPRQRSKADRWNAVIYRYFRQGDSIEDIARDLGVSAKAIKSYLIRIRKHASLLWTE